MPMVAWYMPSMPLVLTCWFTEESHCELHLVAHRYSKDQLQEEIKDVNDQMKKEEESKGSLQVCLRHGAAVLS